MVKLTKPRGATARIAEMTRASATAAPKVRATPVASGAVDPRWDLDVVRARIAHLELEVASLRGHQADADRLAGMVRELTAEVSHLRARVTIWKACARMLFGRLVSLKAILARLRSRMNAGTSGLIGGREHMKRHAATLPSLGGSPYSSQVRSEPIDADGDE